jgi:adenine-specific DNA-methyltransferase
MTLFDIWKGDEGDTFEEGWRNKLIWGDNKLVTSSLIDQYAGRIDLIYIDPPFATGADFSVTATVGEDPRKATKAPSAIEEKAYRDTWGSGLDSYLWMLYERLMLMRDLLSPSGSIFVHVDRRVGPQVKHLLDEVFGTNALINEIVWCYTGPSSPGMRGYANKHDTIYWYGRGSSWTFNVDEVRLPYAESTKGNEGRRTASQRGTRILLSS